MSQTELLDTSLDESLLGKLDTPELRERWPHAMAEMIDVVEAALVRAGEPEDTARRHALTAIAALGEWGGGRQWYLPKGETLRTALRDEEMYAQWGPLSPRELAARYRLSEARVYQVLNRLLSLHRRKVQPDLFGGES